MTQLTLFGGFVVRVLRSLGSVRGAMAKPMLAAIILGPLCFPAELRAQFNGRSAMDPVKLQQKLVGRVGKTIKLTEVDGSSVTGILASYDADSVDILIRSAGQPLHLLDARIAKIGGTNHVYPVLVAGAVILLVVAYAKGGVY